MAKQQRKRTPAQDAAWAHGSLGGACGMIRQNAERIRKAPTATDATKRVAAQIVTATYALAYLLKDRKDG